MEQNFESLIPARARRDTLLSDRFNPAMLITAREARGLTQAELADDLKISQALVGKWEADISVPSPDQLALVANRLNVQPDLFFVDRPRRLASMSDFYHRALAKARRADVKAIHARCNIVDLQIDRLLSITNASAVDRIPDIDPENHAGNIEKIATMARVAMGVGAGPIKNLVEVIEACGGIIIDRNMEVDDVEALCRWVPELPKLFFINGSRPADRIRFSLAHELGHTIMHFGRDFDAALAEKQATDFASAFLMPAKDIKIDLHPNLGITDLASLKRKWRVSMQAIVVRAASLKVIDKTRYSSLMVHFARNGWRKSEPIGVDGESPRTFVDLVRKSLETGLSYGDIAKLLFVKESELTEIVRDANSPTWAANGVRMRLAQ